MNGSKQIDDNIYEVYSEGIKYIAIRLSPRKWRLEKDETFFCYMLAYDINKVYENLSKLIFDENNKNYRHLKTIVFEGKGQGKTAYESLKEEGLIKSQDEF